MRGVVIVAMSVVLAACGNDAPITADPDPVAVEQIDPATLTAATVRVRAEGCGSRTELGTATAIGDGLVVTAAHVVAGSSETTLVTSSGDSAIVDVVLFDPALDIAVLRTTDHPGVPGQVAVLRPERGSAGEKGRLALVAGDGTIEVSDVEVLQRVTIETTDIYRDRPVERPGLRLDATIEPGDSGAMVHLPGGGVGIVWSRSTSTDDQAWTVDLPPGLLDTASRRRLTMPVGTGRCP